MTNSFDQADKAARAQLVNPAREVKDGRDTTMTVPRWDRYVAGREAESGGAYSQALATHEKSTAWAGFARETFAKMYDSGMAKEIPLDQRPQGADWVARLHENAEALPEWRALRERARRDAWACGVAAGEALNVLAQQVKPPESDPQSIQDELDLVKSLMEGEDGEGGKTTPKHLRRMAALKRQVQDAKEEHARANQQLAASAASIRSALRGAAQRAQESIGEMDDAIMSLGAGDGAGIASRVSCPPAQLRNALLNNAKLRKVAKLAGRMKSHAIQKQRTKARPGREELCDVKLGSELSHLLPVELVNLAEPDLEALLYRKLTENAAMVYELRGRESKSEGPIIMAVDESGSMSGVPDMWAKAVAFALMEIAARQNRPFAYVHFDSRVSRVDEVPNPRAMKLEELEEMVGYFTGGGTSIAAALNKCSSMLKDAHQARGDKPWKRADVVLVTDGEDGGYAAMKKSRDEIAALGGHVYGIFIGYEPSKEVGSICDEKVSLSSEDIRTGNPTKLGELFTI